MKGKRILICILSGIVILTFSACAGNKQQVMTEEKKEETKEEQIPLQEVSIDFEDGNMSFVALYTRPENADYSLLKIVDYNGSKALKVTNAEGKTPYVAFDIGSMLGTKVENVASIEMTIGTEYATGKFSALSGYIISWTGANLVECKDPWAVYIESRNPNKAVSKIDADEKFVADANNIFLVTIDTDNGLIEGNGNANLYIDNVKFLDALGNVIKADTSVAFVAPKEFEGPGKDMTNLTQMSDIVVFEGFSKKADAWAQDGLEMPPEIIEALVPGAVIEIAYKSTSGDMWIVMPDAQVGWTRIGDGINGKAYINESQNVAQITYEQIVEFCGEDKSTWGARMQTEASGDWEVFSITVGLRVDQNNYEE